MKADIVTGLAFGDEGKGITVDFLCWAAPARYDRTMVVRYNGGQQAGHNVQIGNRSHIHSNFGSGTLRGVPSFISKFCTVYPYTMYHEYIALEKLGIVPNCTIDPLAILTTPYDVAYNQMNDVVNGTCGAGIGTTMKRHINTGYKLYAADLANRQVIMIKLAHIRKYYVDKMDADKQPLEHILEFCEKSNSIMSDYLHAIDVLFLQKRIKINKIDLSNFDHVIFEGAQGILLDMDHGFFPNVTYSNSTSKNAFALCKEWKIKSNNISIYYITRCYSTRHGNGPMLNEMDLKLINNEKEINKTNEWQGNFRIGEIDYNLLQYAIDVDSNYHPDKCIVKNLVVTCNDQRPGFEFGEKEEFMIQFASIFKSYSPDAASFTKHHI